MYVFYFSYLSHFLHITDMYVFCILLLYLLIEKFIYSVFYINQ